MDEAERMSIQGNGPGILEDPRSRLFNPFFTAKSIGKGTGLGLSISCQIVTEKHGDQLTCPSKVGIGTTFKMQIPLMQGSFI